MKVLLHKSNLIIGISLVMLSSSLFAEASTASINQARQNELLHLLKQDCGSCHGLTLKGGLGPALLPENLIGKPVSFLTWTILNGRPGTAMPPWKGLLKPEEAAWIAGVLVRGDLVKGEQQ